MKTFKRFVLLCLVGMAGIEAWAENFETDAESLGYVIYYNITSSVEPYTVEVTRKYSLSDGSYNTENIKIPETVTNPNDSKTYTVTAIGDYAFENCSDVKSVEIPTTVTSIGAMAFEYCCSLTTISGAASVTSIGESAFCGCTSLTGFDIPTGVTTIGNRAFEGCYALTSITIPAATTSIGEYAFYGCKDLTCIRVDGSNTNYDSRNSCNAIIKKSATAPTLLAGCKNTKIPSDVTIIGNGAFGYCTGLTSITIHSGITKIGDYAFCDCGSGLKSVTLKSFPEFGTDAFKNCSSATFTLEFTDTDHPYIASVKDNVPKISSGKYIRTLGSGKWGTIVLPFVPDNKDAFKFYTLKSGTETSITFIEVASDEVTSNVPYLYRNADDSNPATEMATSKEVTMSVVTEDPTQIGDWRLKGTYRTYHETGLDYYVLSGNQFWNSNVGVTIHPLRAFLQNYSKTSAGAKMIIEVEEDDPDGIDAAKLQGELCSQGAGSREQVAGTAYDLSGRKVQLDQSGQSGHLAPLAPSGLYIVGGKKVMVR